MSSSSIYRLLLGDFYPHFSFASRWRNEESGEREREEKMLCGKSSAICVYLSVYLAAKNNLFTPPPPPRPPHPPKNE